MATALCLQRPPGQARRVRSSTLDTSVTQHNFSKRGKNLNAGLAADHLRQLIFQQVSSKRRAAHLRGQNRFFLRHECLQPAAPTPLVASQTRPCSGAPTAAPLRCGHFGPHPGRLRARGLCLSSAAPSLSMTALRRPSTVSAAALGLQGLQNGTPGSPWTFLRPFTETWPRACIAAEVHAAAPTCRPMMRKEPSMKSAELSRKKCGRAAKLPSAWRCGPCRLADSLASQILGTHRCSWSFWDHWNIKNWNRRRYTDSTDNTV